MTHYQRFISLLLAFFIAFSSVGVNAYAGYCACRKQNFVSFLYKKSCCQLPKNAKCCAKSTICEKKCGQTETYYNTLDAKIDKLPAFYKIENKANFILAKFEFTAKNLVQIYFHQIKFKKELVLTQFINWLPPPIFFGKFLLNFCQIYRC